MTLPCWPRADVRSWLIELPWMSGIGESLRSPRSDVRLLPQDCHWARISVNVRY
jgi:hypothetical protein